MSSTRSRGVWRENPEQSIMFLPTTGITPNYAMATVLQVRLSVEKHCTNVFVDHIYPTEISSSIDVIRTSLCVRCMHTYCVADSIWTSCTRWLFVFSCIFWLYNDETTKPEFNHPISSHGSPVLVAWRTETMDATTGTEHLQIAIVLALQMHKAVEGNNVWTARTTESKYKTPDGLDLPNSERYRH